MSHGARKNPCSREPALDPQIRVGLLGGTFDPIHRGHLAIAAAARLQLKLDRVILVPSGAPPHKETVSAPPRDRLRMAEIACREQEGLEASPAEVQRPGRSYTVATLEEFHRQWPGARFYFILGEDALADVGSWFRSQRVLELAEVVVAPRPHSPGTEDMTVSCTWLDMDADSVSSREIREDIRAARPFEDRVPASVAEYIRDHRLYGYRPPEETKGRR